jgi:hypothetical protein
MIIASDYLHSQETELIRIQHPTTALPTAPIAQARQRLDPATTESTLYCNVMVLVDPAEMAPIDFPQWVIGSKLWVGQVLRF